MSEDILPEERSGKDSFEDRIDVLVHELELAVKWDRPSILFAIYRSEFVRAQAEAALKNQLNSLGLQVVQVHAREEAHPNLLDRIKTLKNRDKTALFIDGFKWECGPEGARVFKEVNQNREYFIDNNIRAIFWLYEDQVSKFANNATECWILRHRVVEFTDAPRPVQDLLHTLESIWDGLDEDLEPEGDLPVKSIIEILENGLPEGKEANSVHANLLLTLGILYWRKGKTDGALRFLNAALEIADLLDDPQLVGQCNNAISLAKSRPGDAEGALDAYGQVRSLNPEMAIPWNTLGQLLSQRERNEEALIVYKRGTEQEPSNQGSWEGLGHTFVKLGLCQNAISAFQHALAIDPGLDSAQVGLGNAYSGDGQMDKAEAAYLQATEINGNNPLAWFGIAGIFAARKMDGQALRAYQRVTEIEPENARAWREQGNLHLKAGDFNRGVLAFEKVLVLRPTCGWAMSSLAYAQAQLGNLAEAASLFQRSIPLFEKPKDQAILWSHLAEAYRRQGDKDRAMAAYAQVEVLREARSSSGSQEDRSDPYMILGEGVCGRPAGDTWTETTTPATSSSGEIGQVEIPALRIKPDLAPPETGASELDLKDAIQWNELGNNLLRAGSYNDAIAAYTKAIELAPEQNWPYISNLAHAYYHKGKIKGKKTSGQPEDPDLWGGDDDEMELPAELEDDLPLPERNDGPDSQDQEISQPETLLATVDESVLNDLLAGLPDGISGEWSLDPNLPQDCPCQTTSESPALNDALTESNPATDPVNLAALVGSGPNEDPGNSIDWNELGNAYARNGEYERATNAYKKAIAMNPGFGLPYSNLGFIYFHQGEYPIAIALYKKGLELLDTPDDKATTWNRLGDAYRRLREYGNALKAYEHAGGNDPVTSPIAARARVALMGNSPQ